MEQSFKNQKQLANYLITNFIKGSKELEYLTKALNDQIDVLEEVRFFKEVVDKYRNLSKQYEEKAKNAIIFMLEDVEYLKKQEKNL